MLITCRVHPAGTTGNWSWRLAWPVCSDEGIQSKVGTARCPLPFLALPVDRSLCSSGCRAIQSLSVRQSDAVRERKLIGRRGLRIAPCTRSYPRSYCPCYPVRLWPGFDFHSTVQSTDHGRRAGDSDGSSGGWPPSGRAGQGDVSWPARRRPSWRSLARSLIRRPASPAHEPKPGQQLQQLDMYACLEARRRVGRVDSHQCAGWGNPPNEGRGCTASAASMCKRRGMEFKGEREKKKKGTFHRQQRHDHRYHGH